MQTGLRYPESRREEGHRSGAGGLSDPYRWLEDPDAPDTVSWADAQCALTDSYLSQSPFRKTIAEHLEQVYNYPKAHGFSRRGERVFLYRNDGLQNHDVLWRRDGTGDLATDPTAAVVLDPNTFSEDGTVSAKAVSVSHTGKFLAYGRTESGSDWTTFKVVQVSNGKQTNDSLERAKFTGASWLHDDSGFFYSRYPAPAANGGKATDENLYHAVYLHKLGDAQECDILVYEDREHPRWLHNAEITDDGKAVLVHDYDGCRAANQVAYARLPLSSGESVKLTRLVEGWEGQYDYITSTGDDGSKLLFLTSDSAPRKRVVEIDLRSPEKANWRELVPEHEGGAVLKYAVRAGKRIMVLAYMRDACDYLEARDVETGEVVECGLALPGICSVVGLSSDRTDPDVFISYTSFTEASTTIRFVLESKTVEEYWKTTVGTMDSSAFEAKQVFYNSNDGTRIPMFVVSKKGIALDGSNLTYLYGYGGFNIGMSPSFNTFRLALVQHAGFILAYPCIRGGNEYGELWHEGAMHERKQNCFDDFYAAAEHLVSSGYTRPEKICVSGGSNGGLLMGACLTQRPELFGCIVARVGLFDMLRFHKFTIGHAWISEFGDPDIKEQFDYISKYSPLHNVHGIKAASLPAVLLTTADHDDRVVPLHSFKFISEVQHVFGKTPAQKQPLLIRIERKAGHGMGIPLSKAIIESADIYAFIIQTLGASWV